jgi:hypothetical protein
MTTPLPRRRSSMTSSSASRNAVGLWGGRASRRLSQWQSVRSGAASSPERRTFDLRTEGCAAGDQDDEAHVYRRWSALVVGVSPRPNMFAERPLEAQASTPMPWDGSWLGRAFGAVSSRPWPAPPDERGH